MKLRYYKVSMCGLVVALSSVAQLMTGCSNNVEQDLYPDSEEHITLTISPDMPNNILTIGSSQTDTKITVKTSTRWTVEVSNCEGSWCQIVYDDSSEAGHMGLGSFTIESAANRSDRERQCTVTVYAIDREGTHIPGKSVEIQVEQDRQSIDVEYNGDVISAYGTTQSQEPMITVKANQAWSVSATHDWITIIPGEGMDGDNFNPTTSSSTEETVSFHFSVQPNPGTSTRTAEITISSPTSSFTPHRLNVTQEGSTETFFITPSSVSDIPYTGDDFDLQVYSPREGWTAAIIPTDTDWISLDRTSGEASNNPVAIRVTVAANNEAISRHVGIVFTRDGDKGTTTVTLTQVGNLDTPNPNNEPVVSTPWIAAGWTSSYAELRAYYRSPSPEFEITGCGAYLHPVGDEATERDYSGSLGENDLIIVELDDLEPDTEYWTQPYVKYTLNGNEALARGGVITFSTPPDHEVPNPDDNNPPSVN